MIHCHTYLNILPWLFSPHHFKRTLNLGAGGGVEQSQSNEENVTSSCPRTSPGTSGGRPARTVTVFWDFLLTEMILLQGISKMFELTKSFFRLSFGHLSFTKSRQPLPLILTASVAKEVVSYKLYSHYHHLLKVIKVNYFRSQYCYLHYFAMFIL